MILVQHSHLSLCHQHQGAQALTKHDYTVPQREVSQEDKGKPAPFIELLWPARRLVPAGVAMPWRLAPNSSPQALGMVELPRSKGRKKGEESHPFRPHNPFHHRLTGGSCLNNRSAPDRPIATISETTGWLLSQETQCTDLPRSSKTDSESNRAVRQSTQTSPSTSH